MGKRNANKRETGNWCIDMVIEKNIGYIFFPDDMSEQERKQWLKERSTPEALKALKLKISDENSKKQ